MPGRPFGWMLACAISLLTLGGSVEAVETVQDPGTFVVDRANVLDEQQEKQINGWLRELEQKTTAQVKVLTIPSTQPEDIFTFSQRHFDLWKLGREDVDNGALIVLAPNDREVRIHTGYGLEGVLPDSYCGTLSREAASQYFKQGRYGDGLYYMAVAVANEVADDAGVQLSGIPDIRHREQPQSEGPIWLPCCCVAFIMFWGALGNLLRRRHRRHMHGWGGFLFDLLFWSSVVNRRRGGWSSSSSGGFGSFGGGSFGGGSFGGGGMSGGGGGGASW